MADTDAQAQEIGRHFMWTEANRMKGSREHNDRPDYQSREALRVKQQRPTGRFGNVTRRMTYEEQQELNIVIVGSLETVTAQWTKVITDLNSGSLLIYGNEGPMAQKDTLRFIELLGKEVIPALHEIKWQSYE